MNDKTYNIGNKHAVKPEKLNKAFLLRCTDYEYAQWKIYAKAVGFKSLSDYIRTSCNTRMEVNNER